MNELDKRIEKYLNGEMEEIEILSFEEEILADKNLKESIEFKKDLIAFFESRNSKLNENLESLGNDFFKDEKATGLFLNNKLIALGLIILMLFIGTSYYMFFLGKDNKEDVRKEQVEDSSEIDILIEKEIIQEIIQEETNEEEENLLPTFKPSKVLEKPIDTNQQPIASTDNFIQNPNLELLIRENVRSKNVEFTLINKPDNQTLSLFDGSANLKISGSMNIDDTIELIIYDNNIDNFNKDNSFLNKLIKPSLVSKGSYNISFNAMIPFEKGLYYYILKVKGTNQILSISKFFVK